MRNNETKNHSKEEKSEVVEGFVIKEMKPKVKLYGEYYDPIKVSKKVDALEERIKDIKTETDKANSVAKDIERKINATTTFLMFVVGGVIIAFALATIPLCFDYYKDNYGQYERYLKDVNELKIKLEALEKRNDSIMEKPY